MARPGRQCTPTCPTSSAARHPHLELFDTFGAAADHADWTASALAVTAASSAQVTSAAADGARAWWQFLDERQTTA